MDKDKKYTILLVDDDDNFREILKAKLEAENFVIKEAVDGQDGLEKAKVIKPDLIVLDIRMPKMSGVQALLKIKADPEIASIKVIFSTNFGENQQDSFWLDDKFAKEAGAVGYVKKTDDLSLIVGRIKQELGLTNS